MRKPKITRPYTDSVCKMFDNHFDIILIDHDGNHRTFCRTTVELSKLADAINAALIKAAMPKTTGASRKATG